MDKLLLSIRETAEALGVGETLAKKRIYTGEIPSVLIGDRRLVPADGLRAYVASLVGSESLAGSATR